MYISLHDPPPYGGAPDMESAAGRQSFIRLFGFLPQGLHLAERKVVQRIPLCGSLFLHVIEAADELLVRTLQRRFGIDAVEPRSVDQRKEQVAELGFEVRFVARAHLGLDLGGLLLHLVPHILALLPVEARRRGLLAYAECLDQRRQRAGNAAQRTALAILLRSLSASQFSFTWSGVLAWMSP